MSRRAHIIGVRVRDTTSEIRMATARVMANSRNSRPTTSAMNSSGISTAISEKVREIRVKPICFAPLSAALSGVSPSSRWRAMFSSMTMASSTTKPVAMVRAISVRLLMEKPARYITAKVPTRDSGTAMEGMMVALIRRRNRKVTITTRAMARNSSWRTSVMAARMVWVRSVSTRTSIPAGRLAVIDGSSAWMRSTTSITLAPGWRWMFSSTASFWLAQAARRSFSAPSTISATSFRRRAAPLL
ncbi:hypothetical protein D9M71_272350 [compost metagenome]